MRIGILTYHRSYNYGAFMQCYSLFTRLKNDFPQCDVEVIDYLSKEVYCNYHSSFKNHLYLISHADSSTKRKRYVKSFLLFLANKVKGKKHSNAKTKYFDDAIKQLSLSDKHLITDDVDEISKYINKRYDVVVVGSDAVWNFQMRPFPNVYFLGKTIKTKKLSYAASSYAQPYKNLPGFKLSFIRNAWRSFDYIGVRDVPTEDFVKFADSSLEPHHNCDPTVFLDMKALEPHKDTVYEKLLKAGFDPNKKTIGLMAGPWLASSVKECVGDDYQLVSVFRSSQYADVNLMDISPFEWAVCFSFFDLTITHYFHGNLLSLKNGTPTLVIEQKTSYNQQYCSKIRDLMRRIGLESNCYFLDELSQNGIRGIIEEALNRESIKGDIYKGLLSEANYCESFKTALSRMI